MLLQVRNVSIQSGNDRLDFRVLQAYKHIQVSLKVASSKTPTFSNMPYTIGLQSATAAFLSAGFATQFTIAVVAFLFIVIITSVFEEDTTGEPDYLPGFSLFHINAFFCKRYDLFNWGFHATGQNIFQLKLLRVRYYLRCSSCFRRLNHNIF